MKVAVITKAEAETLKRDRVMKACPSFRLLDSTAMSGHPSPTHPLPTPLFNIHFNPPLPLHHALRRSPGT